ncbi:MAG: SDR family NAD(P)-dependent oxidoreductase [Bdellovibrionales bacterium]
MKVLVTGATGFLGEWLAERLVKEGHHVQVLCRNPSKLSAELQKQVHVICGDIVEKQDLEKASLGCEVVFHLAGYIGYTSSERQQMEQVNVLGTENAVHGALKAGVRRFIHMSSVVTVGASPTPEVLNENSTYNLAPYNFGYPETKRAAEQLVVQAVQSKGLDSIILNPSTIYGAGDALKGSRNTQLKVARGRFPFYTRGGVSVVNVEAIVDACIQACTRGKTGERYILSGENVTIQQLFQMIAHEAGVKPPRFFLPNTIVRSLGQLGDFLEKRGKKGPVNSESAYMSTLYHWFDSTKAAQELSFKSQSAKESIKASVQWMKQEGLLNP